MISFYDTEGKKAKHLWLDAKMVEFFFYCESIQNSLFHCGLLKFFRPFYSIKNESDVLVNLNKAMKWFHLCHLASPIFKCKQDSLLKNIR